MMFRMSNLPPTPPAVPPPPPKRGWWSRNWKWVVPVVILLPVLACGTCFTAVFGLMKSSEPYKTAVERAKNHPAVIAALGTPIKEGFMASGTVNTSGDSGNADLSIPISGPKGSGTIHVVGSKSGGKWSYSVMEVRIKDTVIPLAAPSLPAP